MQSRVSLLTVLFFISSQVIGQGFLQNGAANEGGDLLGIINGQQLQDSLIIEGNDGQKIRLMWPAHKNIKKMNDWEQLLQDFQLDFGKVVEELPDYDFCYINYNQKKNLVVNEVRGRETYSVNEMNGMDNVKSNLARLVGERVTLLMEFTEYEQLLRPTIKTEITAALMKVKNRFYTSAISPERHYYNSAEDKLVPPPKGKTRFSPTLGARVGMVKDKPYVELRPGLGLIYDNRSFISLNLNFLTTYNQENRSTDYDGYLGLVVGSIGHGLGSEVGFRVIKDSSVFEGMYCRAGVNYKTKSSIVYGFEYYLKPRERDEGLDYLFGFKLGYGF